MLKRRMQNGFLFVTGTDTGVGKTVVAAALTRELRACGIAVAALKPVCSGGREDARCLLAAAGRVLSLDEVNPWHFRAAIAPVLAARRERKQVRLGEVVQHLRTIQKRFKLVVVEGAGGLLSPLGEGFDSRDLINALRAIPVIVAFNKVGVINQVRLVLEALPRARAESAGVLLVNPARPDTASRTNVGSLSEFIPRRQISVMKWSKSENPPLPRELVKWLKL